MRKSIFIVLACFLLGSAIGLYVPNEAGSAATVTWEKLKDYDPEDILYRATITFDAAYITYGEVIDARPYMTEINYAMIESAGESGYIFAINDSLYSTGYLKIRIREILDTAGADTLALSEVATGTDVSGYTGLTILISGKQ